MRFGRGSGLFRVFRLGSSRVNYEAEVGTGLGSSLVSATLGWIARAFPEAPPAVWEPNDDAPAQEKLDRRHPMVKLLNKPNPFFTGPQLWWATLIEWHLGDAYWIKVRARSGTPVELWWAPSWQMAPKIEEGSSNFVDYYEYTVDGEPFRLEPADVVHFRYGSDPDNPRKGLSPMRAMLREIFTDDEAANFTASILRNMGVPGIMVSPDADSAEIRPEEAETVKADIRAKFTGDRRGEPVVMSAKTKLEQFGFSPEQLLLRELRQIPEERVTAATGIPAVVVGLGAGLARSTFTNFAEAREAAYEQGIIPMQTFLAEDVRWQLLTDFETDDRVHELRFGFDLSKVRVLQEDEYRKWQRYDVAVRGGWAQVAEARRAAGLEVGTDDRVYLRQMGYAAVPAGGGEATIYTPAANGNGNGAKPAGVGSVELANDVAREVVRELEVRERLQGQAHSRR